MSSSISSPCLRCSGRPDRRLQSRSPSNLCPTQSSSRVSIGCTPISSGLVFLAPNHCSRDPHNAVEVSNVGEELEDLLPEPVEVKNENAPTKFASINELMQKLKKYGVTGVLSYGLLNTVYYLITFLLVWFYFAPFPGRMGYRAAVKRFLKVMAMVWAGSQVTKIFRVGGALAMAPFVAKVVSWFTLKFKFESEGKASAAIAGLCLGVTLVLFFSLTVLWA